MKKDNTFIIMWCDEGLESIVPIHMEEWYKYQSDIIINKLAYDNPPKNKHVDNIKHTVCALQLRAQANFQRNYEIYSLSTSFDIDEEYLRALFDTQPQVIVDLIREKGLHIYGWGKKSKPLII